MAQIGTDIAYAEALLKQGKLVAIPTETVYGLAANALIPKAVSAIFEAKQRPSFDPLIVHIASVLDLDRYVCQVPEKALKLADAFWPGPLTLILPRKSIIPDLTTSGLDTVGIRVPRHPLTRALLQQLDFPLAAPSANPFGYISPTSAQHVMDQLGDKIPYILDGGECTVGVESTIVGFENDQAIVYRLGGMELEAIEACIGPVSVRAHSSSNPLAPGMLESHYAPRKKLYLGEINELLKIWPEGNVLSFKRDYTQAEFRRLLSKTGDINEAAQNLFSALRELDNLPGGEILAELLPEIGLGLAINDRLRRAAAD